jgi:WD40 repeat protein
VAFSPDGTTLASSSFDGTVRLWDVAILRPIGALPTGRTSSVTSVALGPDGTTLAAGTVRLWDVATQRPVGSILTTSPGEQPRGSRLPHDDASKAPLIQARNGPRTLS